MTIADDVRLRKGDEVLVRGRVLDPDWYENPLVELYDKVQPYAARVRRDRIEKVIPADETRTWSGYTVAVTRSAIRTFDTQISELRASAPTDGADELKELEIASLEGVREDLVRQLKNIGVSVEDEAQT